MSVDRATVFRVMRLIPSLIWMALIFALSSQREFPSPRGLSVEIQAVVAHLVLFGTLALLLSFAFADLRFRVRRFGLLIIALVTLYGISDEIHQSFVPGRSATVFDIVIDCLGASLTMVALGRLHVWRRAER